jgi:hypothetical protein
MDYQHLPEGHPGYTGDAYLAADNTTCPMCGDGDFRRVYVRPRIEDIPRGPLRDEYVEASWTIPANTYYVTMWSCCWRECMPGHGHHVYLEDEDCSCCGSCPEYCGCETCGACYQRVEDVCSSCRACDSCCDCLRCDNCGDRVAGCCGDCYRCEDCGCSCGSEFLSSWNHVPECVPFYGDKATVLPSRYGNWPDAPDDQPYLGLEIETEAVHGSTSDIARVWVESNLGVAKTDGSLDDGVECVTYPHTYHALRETIIAETLGALHGEGARAWDTGTCGLHTHISRRAFKGRSHQWRFCAVIGRLENDLVRLGGRGSTSYATWDTDSDYTPTRVIAGKANQYNRYQAINLQNSATIELRFWRGSIQPLTILGVAAVVDALVRWTRDMSLPEIRDSVSFGSFYEWVTANLDADQVNHITQLCEARRVRLPATV